MLRPALVAGLTVSLLLAGCASHKPIVARGVAETPGTADSAKCPRWVRYDSWLDEYPWLRGRAYCATGTVVAIAVGGGLVLCAWLEDENTRHFEPGSDPYHPPKRQVPPPPRR